ncbi:MAG: DUF4197 family protein [Bacteroidales bacterium]|nr:DUF4197 family protein [Bacteroidales bacterium]
MKIFYSFKATILISLFLITFSSCDVANQLVNEFDSATQTTELTEMEVTKGLKRALSIGTEIAVSGLSKPEAFYRSDNYKILLPKEANIITENKNNPLLQAIGIDKMINDVEKSMNTAAEKAVIKAKPIFIQAITNMSIQDAFGILQGNDTAASHYLRKQTYSQLYQLFKPDVSQALKQPLYQGISTQKAWSDLTNAYNNVAIFVPSWNKVNTQLDDYVTQKALHALFEEVKKEEKKIRKDPAARVDEILRRVFG